MKLIIPNDFLKANYESTENTSWPFQKAIMQAGIQGL